MRNIDEIREVLKQHRQELEEKYKVKEIALFGSYVRDDQMRKVILMFWLNFESP